MSRFELFLVVFGAVLLVGAALWAAYLLGRDARMAHYNALRREYYLLKRQLHDKDEEMVLWQNTFDQRAEERAREMMREWWPDVNEIARGDFRTAERMAEYMRKNRQQQDTGRPHPPREDQGGEPARISRIRANRTNK